MKQRWTETPWLWLMPILIPFLFFLLLPVVQVIWLSFHEWDWFENTWRGLGQYRRLWRDPGFWAALRHTIVFTAVVVPAWLLLTLSIASIIEPMLPRWRSSWATVFFLSYMISPVVLAMVWTWMLGPDQTHLVNRMLGWIGLGPFPWLTSTKLALAGVILSTVITIPGSGVLIYGAALSALPRELYESAKLDGAGRFSQWRLITLPLLKPATLYLAVIYTIASFQVFERVYLMTGGGPAGSTTVLVERIHSKAFMNFDFGGAAAQSVVLLVLIAAVAWGQFAALRDEVQY